MSYLFFSLAVSLWNFLWFLESLYKEGSLDELKERYFDMGWLSFGYWLYFFLGIVCLFIGLSEVGFYKI